MKSRTARLKLHGWNLNMATVSDSFYAPHGNRYSAEYINNLTDDEFEKLLKDETI